MSSTSPPEAPERASWFDRVWARGEAFVNGLRRRYAWFDHLARAGGRYQRQQGDLLAAGVTYFAFLGLFPVLLMAASVVGLFLAGDKLLQQELYTAIRETFPGALGNELVRQVQSAIDGAGFIGLIALLGFLYAGLRMIDKLRIGMELIWKGRVEESDVLRDNLQDLLALLAIGGVGLASLGLTGVVTQATEWVLDLLGLSGQPWALLTAVLGIGLAVAVDVVVFLWLLRVVPSVSYPLRVLLPGALFGAAGFEMLKLIGGYYLTLIDDSVTVTAFGGAVGLLIWINLVARFAFVTAAWTASHRRVAELSVPAPDDAPAAA